MATPSCPHELRFFFRGQIKKTSQVGLFSPLLSRGGQGRWSRQRAPSWTVWQPDCKDSWATVLGGFGSARTVPRTPVRTQRPASSVLIGSARTKSLRICTARKDPAARSLRAWPRIGLCTGARTDRVGLSFRLARRSGTARSFLYHTKHKNKARKQNSSLKLLTTIH
jgi:hypothetical protein